MAIRTYGTKALTILAGICMLLATSAVSHGDTVFHYRVTDTTVLPNIPSIGGADGTAQGDTSLELDVPTVGLPAGAGNRSIGVNTSGGVNSAGTQELTNALIIANGGFTYECWFKWFGGGSYNAIIDYAGTDKFRVRYGDLDMRFEQGSEVQVLVPSPTQDEWHYIAGVFEHDGNPESGGKINGTLRWYYDGTAETGSAPVTKDDFGDTLNRAIGTGRHPLGFDGDMFNGLVYEPRVTLGVLLPEQLLYGLGADGDGIIPEPLTMALLGLAVAGLGGYVRRRTA